MSNDDPDTYVVEMMEAAAQALADDGWCSVIPMPIPVVWSYVLAPSQRVVRRLRGRKMRTSAQLMDEFGAALQFGDYFGENGPALDECLSDLDWLPTKVGYVFVIVDPEQVLADGTDEHGRPTQELSGLVQILRTAAETFAEAIERGAYWDRPALEFDVILAPTPENVDRVRHVWRLAGAPLKA